MRTAQTTQDAAENRLNNGLATLPDVLNARAETSQAVFDEESADGDEKIARVTLTEVVGADPSPDIAIDSQRSAPLPERLNMSIEALIDRAMENRPELMAQALRIRSAEASIRAARAEYKPQIALSDRVAQTSMWPSPDYGQLGFASEPTWSAELGVHWRIFDGGVRKNELLIAESKRREAEDELTTIDDETTREVWIAYIAFRTALRKHDAAVALLESANASYSASLDAYKYGVKNLVDVVTAGRSNWPKLDYPVSPHDRSYFSRQSTLNLLPAICCGINRQRRAFNLRIDTSDFAASDHPVRPTAGVTMLRTYCHVRSTSVGSMKST